MEKALREREIKREKEIVKQFNRVVYHKEIETMKFVWFGIRISCDGDRHRFREKMRDDDRQLTLGEVDQLYRERVKPYEIYLEE